MRLLDFLNWFPGFKQYRDALHLNNALVEQNRQLTLKVISLTDKLTLHEGMKCVATLIAPIPRKQDPAYAMSEKGERMSTLTWHEERLMRVELQAVREQIARLLTKNKND